MNRLVNDSRKCEILLFKISIIVVSVIVLVMSIVGAYYFKNCLWDKESLNLILTLDTLFAVFITFFSFSNDKSSNIFGISPNEIIRTQSEVYQFLFTKSFAFKNTFTSFYYILQYLLKQLYFELLNKCFYIILQRFTTLLPLFCPF
ncbi:Uncharacterised protein [Streptococcus pneumoniae]|uniref:Uncharacterized protein n=1 Tax=Streptococcus pneumoniae TaxID=1313 RepID=A0A4J1QJG8_STREE|nr:Uncharacterised protein [Streptococcus pneumoniae]VNO95495.1 Uncharacterised protein [Streptococcus pneumoniae]